MPLLLLPCMAMGEQQGLLTADLQDRMARFNAAVDREIDEAVREDRLLRAVDRGIDEAVREDRLQRAVDRGTGAAVGEDRALRAVDRGSGAAVGEDRALRAVGRGIEAVGEDRRALREAARSEPRGLESLRDPKRLKLDVWAEMEQMQGKGICGSQSSEQTNSQLERTKSQWFNVSDIQQPNFNRPFVFSDLGQKMAQWKQHQETLRRDFDMMRMDARPRPTKKRRTGGHEEKAPGGQEATPDK